jgi:glycosyltransferase involved in cell wall biosynthesis
MIFLIHSDTSAGTIAAKLGAPEYSYYFVLAAFRPMLEQYGLVIPVTDPANEVDRIARNAAAHGEACLFLTFSPPHCSFVATECPTIPIFAWEFDTLPTETWDSDPRHDWRRVLGEAGTAITHSAFAVSAVRAAMGADYPIISLPAPVWDRYESLYRPGHEQANAPETTLHVRGRIFDSREMDLSIHLPEYRRVHGIAPLPPLAGREAPHELTLGGVVYTSVFCPMDGRKNWFDMICGFCIALRDRPDATLVLKLTHQKCDNAIINMLEDLAKLSPFACRVVIIDGFLSDDCYGKLAALSTYTVNTSHGEGQCLPLMEYMSAGKPAIAPRHTAMLDYLDAQNGFLIASHREPTIWPHDPREAIRATRHKIDFESLLRAYGKSYDVAVSDPARYAAMSAHAHDRLYAHCSHDVIDAKLKQFLRGVMPARETVFEMAATA